MQGLMEVVVSNEFGAWIAALSTLVAAATSITALTPTQWDNRVVNGLSKVLNILAGNIAKNRNADDA